MERLEDDDHHFFKWRNEAGWIVCYHRVLYGYRVAILHELDPITVYGSYCCGTNYHSLCIVFSQVYRWLKSDPEDVRDTARKLQLIEHRGKRPFPNNSEFVDAILSLETESQAPTPLLSPKEIIEKGKLKFED